MLLLLTAAEKYANVEIHFEHKLASYDVDGRQMVFERYVNKIMFGLHAVSGVSCLTRLMGKGPKGGVVIGETIKSPNNIPISLRYVVAYTDGT